MENWDKGIKMFDEAAPVDKKTLDRLADLAHHRRANVHFLSTRWRPGPGALVLVKDPVTGAYGVPDDQEPE
jgi:hypothetical protein